MDKKRLTAVSRTQGNNAALKSGSIALRSFELDFVEVDPLVQAFRRMVRGVEFDVSEMALTTYLCARMQNAPFTALPIFLVRGFHHGAVCHTTTSAIRTPKDLEGRRVGVSRGYTVTTGVWARGILSEEYGVDLDTITWLRSDEEHVPNTPIPANVEMIAEGDDLTSMLLAGDIDAVVGANIVHPDVTTLIPGTEAAGLDAFRRTGLYPINHLVVVKDELLVQYPDLADELFDAFARSKEQYVERLRKGGIAAPDHSDRMYSAVMDITGADPLPYGIEPNRPTLERLVSMAVAQGILIDPPAIDTFFAPATRDLIA